MSSSSRTRFEFMLAGTAVLVSFVTLGVYLYQSKVMREQQHVSVWPFVEWNTSNVEDYRFTAQNKGVGPAIIRKVEMSVDGRPVKNNRELLTAVLGRDWTVHSLINSSLEGRVLTPGEAVVPFRLGDLKEGRAFEEKLEKHAFQMRITYCSVYGECWTTDGDRTVRVPDQQLGFF